MFQELKLINVPDGLIFRDIVVRCSLLSPHFSFYKINKMQVTLLRAAAKYYNISVALSKLHSILGGD